MSTHTNTGGGLLVENYAYVLVKNNIITNNLIGVYTWNYGTRPIPYKTIVVLQTNR